MDIPSILLVLFCWIPHTLQCLSGEWRCNNRRCIDLERRCNGWDSCGDSSDERNCDRWRCPGGGKWWQCAGKQCIPSRKRCDGNLPGLEDCQDGSDEKNCDRWRCPGEYKWWQCAGKQCIPPRKRCDGLEDCQDGSDEKNCGRLYNGHLTILPSRVVIKGAKEEVTLTCYVSDVYSKQADYFVWSVGACRNRSAGNTCTFTLNAASDTLLNVTCTALRINGRNEVVASGSKTVRLNVTYITALVGETPLQWKLLERSDVVSGIVLLVIAIAVVIAVVITRRKCSRKRRKTTDSTPGNRSSGWYEEIPELPEIQREQGPSPRATDNPTYIFPPLSDAVEVTHPLPHSPDHLMDRPLPDAVDPTHPLPHSPDHMKDRPLPALPGVAMQAAVDEITEQRHPPCDHAEGGSLPYAAMSLASSLPHLPRHNTADQLQSTTTFLGTTRPRLNSNTPIQLRTTISASERHGYTPTKALSSSQRLELHLATAESDTDLDLCTISTLPSRGSDTVIDYLKLLPDDAPICSASRDYLQPVFCKHPDCQGSCQGD